MMFTNLWSAVAKATPNVPTRIGYHSTRSKERQVETGRITDVTARLSDRSLEVTFHRPDERHDWTLYGDGKITSGRQYYAPVGYVVQIELAEEQ